MTANGRRISCNLWFLTCPWDFWAAGGTGLLLPPFPSIINTGLYAMDVEDMCSTPVHLWSLYHLVLLPSQLPSRFLPRCHLLIQILPVLHTGLRMVRSRTRHLILRYAVVDLISRICMCRFEGGSAHVPRHAGVHCHHPQHLAALVLRCLVWMVPPLSLRVNHSLLVHAVNIRLCLLATCVCGCVACRGVLP